MDSKSSPGGWLKHLRVPAATVLAISAVWASFKYLVADPELLLNYVRALAWPMLLAVVLYFIRRPLADKVRDLLQLEVLGSSARFAERQERTEILEHRLEQSISLLGDEVDEEPEASPAPTDPQPMNHQTAQPTGTKVDEPPLPTTPQKGGVDTTAAEAVALRAVLKGVVSNIPGLSDSDRAQLSEMISRADQLKNSEIDYFAKQLIRPPDIHSDRRAREQRTYIAQIIKDSAKWGFDMAKLGAESAQPEIEWDSKGRPRLSEKSRKQIVYSRPAATEINYDPREFGRRLEDEIRLLEEKIGRAKSLPLSKISALGATRDDETRLRNMKIRLRTLDPNSPLGYEI